MGFREVGVEGSGFRVWHLLGPGVGKGVCFGSRVSGVGMGG